MDQRPAPHGEGGGLRDFGAAAVGAHARVARGQDAVYRRPIGPPRRPRTGLGQRGRARGERARAGAAVCQMHGRAGCARELGVTNLIKRNSQVVSACVPEVRLVKNTSPLGPLSWASRLRRALSISMRGAAIFAAAVGCVRAFTRSGPRNAALRMSRLSANEPVQKKRKMKQQKTKRPTPTSSRITSASEDFSQWYCILFLFFYYRLDSSGIQM